MTPMTVESIPMYAGTALNPSPVPAPPADMPAQTDGADSGGAADTSTGIGTAAAINNEAVAQDPAAVADAAAVLTGGYPAFVYTVNVSVAGEWSNLYKLLDYVQQTDGVEITTYSYSGGTGEGTEAAKDSVTMVVKLYIFVDGVMASSGMPAKTRSFRIASISLPSDPKANAEGLRDMPKMRGYPIATMSEMHIPLEITEGLRDMRNHPRS
jgi:hypothetical protein